MVLLPRDIKLRINGEFTRFYGVRNVNIYIYLKEKRGRDRNADHLTRTKTNKFELQTQPRPCPKRIFQRFLHHHISIMAEVSSVSVAPFAPVNFGFDDLKAKMTRFTVRFDKWAQVQRERVLRERNEFAKTITENRGRIQFFEILIPKRKSKGAQ